MPGLHGTDCGSLVARIPVQKMHANLLFRVRIVSELAESFALARSYKPLFAISGHPLPKADWRGSVLARSVVRTPVSVSLRFGC